MGLPRGKRFVTWKKVILPEAWFRSQCPVNGNTKGQLVNSIS